VLAELRCRPLPESNVGQHSQSASYHRVRYMSFIMPFVPGRFKCRVYIMQAELIPERGK
jgi:hypothetical protein